MDVDEAKTLPEHGEPAAAAGGGAGPSGPASHRRRPISMAGMVVVGLVAWGVRMGMHPLHDNSFFTHLATGRIILRTGGVPRVDPYSWTAHGRAWTVQSWLASVIYASIEKAVGLHGIQLLVAASCVALSLITWRLTQSATSIVARLLLSGLALAIGAGLWVERPLLFGLLGLGILLLACEGAVDPRWLIPTMWIWVNTHGSFPLGLALVGVLVAGRWLDTRHVPKIELRCLAWATAGTALGAVNPLGPKLLTFPLELLHRTAAFKVIVEWQPPTWQGYPEKVFAAQLALAVLLLLRRRSWRIFLPLVVFGAAALTSSRNVPVASIALLPGMALGLEGLGSLDGTLRRRAFDKAAAVLVAVGLLLLVAGLTRPATDLSGYPVEASAWMRSHDLLGVHDRVVARDFIGNYLEVRYGPSQVRTFIDDRVDMYPLSLVKDYLALIRPGGDWEGVLRRHHATAVLWDSDSVLGRDLRHSPNWRIVHRDHGWLVAVPR